MDHHWGRFELARPLTDACTVTALVDHLLGG